MELKSILFATLALLTINSCSEPDDSEDPKNIDEELYLNATIDGVEYEFIEPNYYGGSSAISSASSIAFKAFGAHYYYDPDPAYKELHIYFGNFFQKSLLEGYQSDFDTNIIDNPFKSSLTFTDLFSVGVKEYLIHSYEVFPANTNSGVYLTLQICPDGNPCQTWRSYKSNLTTFNTDFEVLDFEILSADTKTRFYRGELDERRGILVTGKFSCWLYNESTTDSLQIENATFSNVFLE